MANRNPTRKRGISVGSSPSLTLRVTIAAARLIQENTGNLRLPKMFTAAAFQDHRCVVLAIDGLGTPSCKTFPHSAKVLRKDERELVAHTDRGQRLVRARFRL